MSDNPAPSDAVLARPSPWFLGPGLSAIALLGLAHGEFVWSVACAVAILSAYFSHVSFAWPPKGRRLKAVLPVSMGMLVAYLYFLTVLGGGRGLHYFPRFILQPWFYTPGAFLSAALLAYVWHTPFRPKERGWAIYALSGWIVICSGQFYRPSSLAVALILFFCVTVLLALLFAPPGHQVHGALWRPAGRQLIWLASWSLIIGLGSWAVIRGLHRLEEDMARLIGELLRLPNYSGSLGAGGTMKLRRRDDIKLSATLVATLDAASPPMYLRTRVLSNYHKGMWRSQWRFTRWMPIKRLDNGHTRFFLYASRRRYLRGGAPKVDPMDRAQTRSLGVRTFLGLSGAMLLPYSATILTIQAQARCRQSLDMTLDCRPLHLLNHYQLQYDPGIRLGRGIAPASLHAMTLPIYGRGKAKRPPRRQLSKDQLPAYLRSGLRPELRSIYKALYPLARKVTGEHSRDPMLAATALQHYFQTNYTYSLKVKLAYDKDPTVDFVLHKRPAYCQYFASGIALMMRSLGHRARVANGFMVKEYNSYAKRWMVRQRDAHAWTEVFDPRTRRWVAFDATAPSILAMTQMNQHKDMSAQLSAWMQLRWKEFLAASRNVRLGDWFKARSLDWLEVLSKPLSWVAIIALVVFVWGLRKRRLLWRKLRQAWASLWEQDAASGASSPQSPLQQRARALFLSTCDAWASRGIVLQPHETPEDYIERLQDLVSDHGSETSTPTMAQLRAFVDAYNALRFFPEGEDDGSSDGERRLGQPSLEAFEALALACRPPAQDSATNR